MDNEFKDDCCLCSCFLIILTALVLYVDGLKIFWLIVLIGSIIVISILLYPKNRKNKEKIDVFPDYKICPVCSIEIDKNSEFCHQCGKKV